MNHVFSDVPKINIPRSVFRRPCTVKTTIGVDYLYPIYVDEVLPGDTFTMAAKFFGRLATPVCPVMDDLYLDTFFFAVPNRLVDPNWKKIMGEATSTQPSTATFSETLCPVMDITSAQAVCHSLHDYLGLPLGVNQSVLPYFHRAYNLIWNEFFRDENLLNYAKVGGNTPSTVGTESAADYVLRRRCKPHDYFTSALPWACKGNPVQINLGQSAPVYGTGQPFPCTIPYTLNGSTADHMACLGFHNGSAHKIDSLWYSGGDVDVRTIAGNASDITAVTDADIKTATKSQINAAVTGGYLSDSGLYADLSQANSATVNQLREAIATQHFLEQSARCGTRYVETILGHFGVSSPDARMQRPEYLGGSSVPLNVNTVAQTSSTDSTSPQGNLAAFITGSSECFWTKSFTEHCVIIGLANIRATVSYQQGIPRMFSRRSRYDFYFPEFANLGEQTVLNKEIYAQGTDDDDGVFGYQERFAEMRYNPNRITSAFRSTYAQSLDYWHLAEKFDSLPTLSGSFVSSNIPIQRVLAVNTNKHEQFILDGFIDLKCARPMPVYSVPGLNRL